LAHPATLPACLPACLQELCGLTKHLQTSQRNALLMRLVHLGLFQVGGGLAGRLAGCLAGWVGDFTHPWVNA
jgi:hypothetical protein